MMEAKRGDYIIQGVNGEVYPCKPDIFAKTYEPADESPSSTEGSDAVEFLEFVVKEKFTFYEGKFWSRDNEEGKFTYPELYQLFLQSKKEKQ